MCIFDRIRILKGMHISETFMKNQTARNEQDVNFCKNDRIVLENKWTIWYNENTEKKCYAQAIGTPVRAPDVRRCQRACGTGADVSEKRIHNGVGFCL